MVQAFCIPIYAEEDAEAATHRIKIERHLSEPVQGWEQWVRDIADILAVCQSGHAVDLVQERNRELLNALRRERSSLYADLGRAFAAAREQVSSHQAETASTGEAVLTEAAQEA